MNNNFMNIMQQMRRAQQNPSQFKQSLYQDGKISKEQYEAIQGMNNFDEIGKYLIDNNAIPIELQNMLQNIIR